MSAGITLGTVQFGLDYGVANVSGRPTPEVVHSILALARSGGVSSLDTAIAYGNSEQVLGSVGVADFRIITKLPPVPQIDGVDIDRWIDGEITGSLQRLGVERLDGVLLHRPDQLLTPIGKQIYRALRGQVDGGRVCRIGISIYDPAELDRLVPAFDFDVVQAPLNILDGRMRRSGWLQRLQDQGTALHVRSIFLQGLLLMPAARRPAYFDRWRSLWDAWDAWLARHQLTPLSACLRYALHVPGVEQVVLGVDKEAQLAEILAVAGEGPLPDDCLGLQITDIGLLNPAQWKLA